MTNSRKGKSGAARWKTRPVKETRYVALESYPGGTGPCGRVCSCNEYCKTTGENFEHMGQPVAKPEPSVFHAPKIIRASELGK
jgi:hypothetical protein